MKACSNIYDRIDIVRPHILITQSAIYQSLIMLLSSTIFYNSVIPNYTLLFIIHKYYIALSYDWLYRSSCSTPEQIVESEILIIIISIQSFSAHILGESHLHQLSHFIIDCLLLCEIFCPLLGCVLIQLFVSLVLSGHLSILWIICKDF